MKTHKFTGSIILFLLVLSLDLFAQKMTLENLLEKTVSLSEKGNQTELTEAIKSASFALEGEAHTRGNEMKDKLLAQAETLKNLAPMATQGSLKSDVLSKVVNTIRLLVGANRINNLLSDGKEGLLGNAETLTGSINLLESGKAALDVKQQDKLGSLLEGVSGAVKKLDSKDAGAKVAASSIRKPLSKIVDLVKETV